MAPFVLYIASSRLLGLVSCTMTVYECCAALVDCAWLADRPAISAAPLCCLDAAVCTCTVKFGLSKLHASVWLNWAMQRPPVLWIRAEWCVMHPVWWLTRAYTLHGAWFTVMGRDVQSWGSFLYCWALFVASSGLYSITAVLTRSVARFWLPNYSCMYQQ